MEFAPFDMGLGRGSDRGPNRSGHGWQAEPLPSCLLGARYLHDLEDQGRKGEQRRKDQAQVSK